MNESSSIHGAETGRSLEAYDWLLPEIIAVPAEQMKTVDIDVPAAVSRILGAMTMIQALRPRIVLELPKFDLRRFDKLEAYALALNQAEAQYLAYERPATMLTALAEEASAMRERFASEAWALSHHEFFDGSRINEIKFTPSYRQIALDLVVLAQIFRANLRAAQGHANIDIFDLDRAVSLADQLMAATAERDLLAKARQAAAELRQKAFTLFSEACRDARRAAVYLEGDYADEFVPAIGASTSATAGAMKAPSSQAESPQQRSLLSASHSDPFAVS